MLLLLAWVACTDRGGNLDDTAGGDTGTDGGADPQVDLADEDLLRFALSYEVQQQEIAAGDGAHLGWAGLSQDTRGRPVDPAADVERLTLLRLVDPSLEASLSALAAGELGQDGVSLQLSCIPQDMGCDLADLAFETGHPVDVAAAFTAGSGPWLAWLESPSMGEPVALLGLLPTKGGPAEVVIGDEASSLHAVVDASQPAPVELPADGQVRIDFEGLAHGSQGAVLSPLRLDRAVLARLPAGLSDDDRVLRLESAADQAWTADLAGQQSLWLPDMLPVDGGAPGPGALDPEGDWVLSLSCGTCLSPQPAVLVALSPQ